MIGVETMWRWRVREFGEPDEVLVLERSAERPEAAEGEVRIRVRACGLNFRDVLQIRGAYQEHPELPFTPGGEVVGERDDDGKRVLVMVPSGGLAEELVVAEASCLPVPDSMTDAQAVALLPNYGTALHGLRDRAQLRPGEVVLVHAGAGGVGSAAIQLARTIGATVYATTRSTEKVTLLQQVLGVDLAINTQRDDLHGVVRDATDGVGVDVVFDTVGGQLFDVSRRLVARYGRYLVVGFTSGRIPSVSVNHLLLKGYSLVGVHWGTVAHDPSALRHAYDDLVGMVQEGRLDPLVMPGVSMAEVAAALDDLAAGRTWGKLVVVM